MADLVSSNDDQSDGAPASRTRRVRSWVRGREGQLEQARSTSTTVSFAFDALSYDTDTGAPVLAAALGFRVFLFEVPYVCFFVIVAGFAADLTGRDVHSYFHGSGITRLTAESVINAAGLSGWARFSAFVLVAYALFLGARSFLKVVNIVHALVWDVNRTRLASPNRAALIFIAIITGVVALSVGLARLRDEHAAIGAVALPFYLVVPFALWWFASAWLPHRRCPLIALAPGAALFAVGAELLHIATVIWFPHYLQNKSDVYGSIGIAIALLLWAYLLGRLMTLGAVLNAALWARFGTEAAHPIIIRRPSWRVPLVHKQVSRIWTALFEDTGNRRD